MKYLILMIALLSMPVLSADHICTAGPGSDFVCSDAGVLPQLPIDMVEVDGTCIGHAMCNPYQPAHWAYGKHREYQAAVDSTAGAYGYLGYDVPFDIEVMYDRTKDYSGYDLEGVSITQRMHRSSKGNFSMIMVDAGVTNFMVGLDSMGLKKSGYHEAAHALFNHVFTNDGQHTSILNNFFGRAASEAHADLITASMVNDPNDWDTINSRDSSREDIATYNSDTWDTLEGRYNSYGGGYHDAGVILQKPIHDAVVAGGLSPMWAGVIAMDQVLQIKEKMDVGADFTSGMWTIALLDAINENAFLSTDQKRDMMNAAIQAGLPGLNWLETNQTLNVEASYFGPNHPTPMLPSIICVYYGPNLNGGIC